MGATPEAAQDELPIKIKANGKEKQILVSVHGLPDKAKKFLEEMIPQFEELRLKHEAVGRNFGLSYHQMGFRRKRANVPDHRELVFRQVNPRTIVLVEEDKPVSCWCSEWDENWDCTEVEC